MIPRCFFNIQCCHAFFSLVSIYFSTSSTFSSSLLLLFSPSFVPFLICSTLPLPLPLQCEATVCMFIFCHLSFLLLRSRSALTRLLAFSFRQCTKLGSGHRQSHRTVITDQWNDPHGPVNHTHTHSHTYLCTDTEISGSSGEVWEQCYVRRLTTEVCVKFEETGRKSPSPDSCEPWKTGLRDAVKCLCVGGGLMVHVCSFTFLLIYINTLNRMLAWGFFFFLRAQF